MVKNDSTVEKLLERSMAKEIMKLLSDEDLSIPQIVKKLKISDIQTIVAFFAELQHFGLIQLSENPSKNTGDNQHKKPKDLLNYDFNLPKKSQFPPLGFSLMEYNKLWEDLSRDDGQINLQQLETLTFTVPNNLKRRFKAGKPSDVE